MYYKKYFKPFPKLNTKNLSLQINSLKDITDIYEIYKEKEVCKYSDILVYTDKLDALKYVLTNLNNYRKNCCYTFTVKLKEINKVIGTITITQHSYNYKILQIGYSFNKNFHKKGYATEALLCLMDFFKNTLKTERVEALVLPQNAASINLLLKLGFKKESTLIKGAILENTTKDVYMFAKIF